MATKSQVRDRAATDLGILKLDRSLPAADNTRIGNAYDEVYAQLKNEGLAIWASDGSVPDEITDPVVLLVAINCMNTYSISVERANRIFSKAGGPEGGRTPGWKAMNMIRKYVTPKHQSLDEPADY